MTENEDSNAIRLVAWVIARSGVEPDLDSLRNWLREHLPAHMVPSRFSCLESLPLTANGKLDRGALAAMEQDPAPTPTGKGLPKTELERRLAAIWEELLGRKGIGIHDDFFDLGGHSLLALKLGSRLKRDLGCDLALARIFRAHTIHALAQLIEPPTDALGDQTTRLHRFRGKSGGVPLFFIPGFFGLGGLRPSLAAALRDVCPYADQLRYAGVDDDHPPHATMTGLVDHLITQIRELHPQHAGPLCVAGFSFGGNVAFEVARRLRESGQPVPLLILYDSAESRGARRRSFPGFAAEVLRRTLDQPRGKRVGFFTRLVGAKASFVGRKLLPASKPRARLLQDMPDLPEIPGDIPPALATSGLLKNSVRLASIAALAAHRTRTYDGRVVLFRSEWLASNEWLRYERARDNGWSPWLSGPFEIIPVSRDHLGVFTEPLHPIVLGRTAQLMREVQSAPEAGPS